MLSTNTQTAINLIKKQVSAASDNNFDGRAVFLFSGGRDSSLVAVAFCNAFRQSQLHLLLIDNGLLSRIDSTKRQANLIKNLFPDTDIIFETKRVSQMIRQVGMQQVETDFIKYKFSSLLICLTCKLTMNFSAIRYARELGINTIIDGYAGRQRNFPEQTPEFMNIIEQLYKKANLSHTSPLYNFLSDKKLVNQVLAELGVYIPKQEPICMRDNSFSLANQAEIVEYTEKTLDLIRQLDPVLRP